VKGEIPNSVSELHWSRSTCLGFLEKTEKI
jgi:hypothetical protein